MYTYREFLNMQKKALSSSDEMLENRNIEMIRRGYAEYKKSQNDDSDIKIYQEEVDT